MASHPRQFEESLRPKRAEPAPRVGYDPSPHQAPPEHAPWSHPEGAQWRIRAETMQRAAAAALGDQDAHDLSAALSRFAAQIASARYALVCIRSGQEIAPESSWPEAGKDAQWPRYEALVRKALRRRRADIYYAEPQLVPPASERESQIVAPIIDSQGQAIGAVVVSSPIARDEFNESDLRALETLVLMYGASYSRARLFDRLQDWSRSFEMVLAFNSAVNRHLPPGELVKRLVELALTFLKAEGGMAGFAIHDAEGAASMATEAYHDGKAWHEYGRNWRPGEGAPGYVLDAEFVYLSNNYADDPAAERELVSRFGVHKLLCVPIRNASGGVLGFFAVHRGADAAPLTWQDAAFLETLGNSTAVAIENVRLLHALEMKNREIRVLSQDHVERLEAERRHISRELHDQTGQVLVGINLGLKVLARNVPPENLALRDELERLGRLVAQSSVQLRDLARDLRPPTLDSLGIELAIEQLARDHERRTGVEIAVLTEQAGSLSELPEPVRTALYRIVQEALTNIAKHAEATRARIRLSRLDGVISLSIVDDGRGFDASRSGSGLGLLGMKERAGMLGGTFEVRSRPGEGTQVCLTMPF